MATTRSLIPPTIHRPEPREDESPLLIGDGPAECSTSTALVGHPSIIWDVNSYYRELKVSPWASKGELRRAYHEAVSVQQSGVMSRRLTYILSQLLKRDIRAEYDAMPPGSVFLDRYIHEWIKKKAMAAKSDRLAFLHEQDVDMDGLDLDAIERDIYTEMGWDAEPVDTPSDTPPEVVDEPPALGEDGPRPAKFEFAYYLWATPDSRSDSVHRRLIEWQALLVSAFAREGVHTVFAVGLHGKPHRWVMATIGYRTVFLLGDVTEPTEELAVGVVSQYLAQ